MLPVFFAGWPLLLLPVHIAFLQLIIDPACTLIFESEAAEADVMRRPPRDPKEGLFSKETLTIALLQGSSILAVCVGVFLLARRDHSAEAARALTFATLVVAFVVVILVNRSWTRSAVAMLKVPNPALRWVLLGAVALLTLSLAVPWMQRMFHFAPLEASDLALSLGAGFFCVLWFEVVKVVRRRTTPRAPGAIAAAPRAPTPRSS
jgi:Ca2+-transporting ATPase